MKADDSSSDLLIQKWMTSNAFAWMNDGDLTCYKIGRHGVVTSSLILYVPRKQSETITITGSIRDVARVIRIEHPEISEDFLKEELPRFVVFTNARPISSVMNQDFIDSFNISSIKDQATQSALMHFCKGGHIQGSK